MAEDARLCASPSLKASILTLRSSLVLYRLANAQTPKLAASRTFVPILVPVGDVCSKFRAKNRAFKTSGRRSDDMALLYKRWESVSVKSCQRSGLTAAKLAFLPFPSTFSVKDSRTA